jgi:hypothetical protein
MGILLRRNLLITLSIGSRAKNHPQFCITSILRRDKYTRGRERHDLLSSTTYKENRMNSEMQAETAIDAAALEAPGAMTELSGDELDTIAGGMSLNMGSASQFFQREVMMGQQTFAGPNGAGTTNFFASRETASAASQFFQAQD